MEGSRGVDRAFDDLPPLASALGVINPPEFVDIEEGLLQGVCVCVCLSRSPGRTEGGGGVCVCVCRGHRAGRRGVCVCVCGENENVNICDSGFSLLSTLVMLHVVVSGGSGGEGGRGRGGAVERKNVIHREDDA